MTQPLTLRALARAQSTFRLRRQHIHGESFVRRGDYP